MGPDKYIKNFIGGTLIPASSGAYFDNRNPATGKVYSLFPNSAKEDVQKAVDAAKKAFPSWSKLGVQRRFRLLMRLADVIEQNLEAFAIAESIDSGKPISMSRQFDVPRAHENFRFFASAVLHFSSESHHMEGEAINFTMRQPIGIVGCISPWNLPLYLLSWKIAPALAVGNTVIAKPSEITPMTAFMLSKACMEAGIPPGVLNIVHGDGAKVGQAIVEHPDVQAISFTGGSATGIRIAETAAPLLKKVSLELGGKNPNIIFADCDFDAMILGTLRSSFSNNGQLCLSGSRIYVERSIYNRFREEFVKRTQFLKIGDPMGSISDLGSMSSAAHMEKVLSYVALAEMEGGTILCGGDRLTLNGDFKDGSFMRPAIIEGLDINSRTNQEEIFGPVVTITPFDTEKEVIQLANTSNFGLSASIWTRDISKANRIAEQIKVGTIWINCWMVRDLRTPFGGLKNSGLGREGGLEALRFFTEAKNVCLKY